MIPEKFSHFADGIIEQHWLIPWSGVNPDRGGYIASLHIDGPEAFGVTQLDAIRNLAKVYPPKVPLDRGLFAKVMQWIDQGLVTES